MTKPRRARVLHNRNLRSRRMRAREEAARALHHLVAAAAERNQAATSETLTEAQVREAHQTAAAQAPQIPVASTTRRYLVTQTLQAPAAVRTPVAVTSTTTTTALQTRRLAAAAIKRKSTRVKAAALQPLPEVPLEQPENPTLHTPGSTIRIERLTQPAVRQVGALLARPQPAPALKVRRSTTPRTRPVKGHPSAERVPRSTAQACIPDW